MAKTPDDSNDTNEFSPLGAKPTPRRKSRRTFLGAAGGVAVGTAIATHFKLASAQALPGPSNGRSGRDRLQDEQQRKRALKVRIDAAWSDYQAPVAAHPTNGDEERYPNKIGTDTRSLPHDDRGEVDPAAWTLAHR